MATAPPRGVQDQGGRRPEPGDAGLMKLQQHSTLRTMALLAAAAGLTPVAATNGGHSVHLDELEPVIEAIRSVLDGG